MTPALAILHAVYAVLGLIFTTAIVIALIVNIWSMKARDTNFKRGFSTTVLFLPLLVENAVWLLEISGDGTPAGISRALVFCGGTHVAAAGIAMWGFREMRTQRRWFHGRERAIWGFWLNVVMLLVLCGWFSLRSNRELRDRILG